MKIKMLLLSILAAQSILVNAQHFTLSGAYSPTFESYNIGLGMGGMDFLMDYQIGFSDEFIAMGMDLQFALTGDLATRSHNLSIFYLGFGGEMYLMDELDADIGYALYGMASISINQFIFSYGYGIYEYDGLPMGELDGFHKLKLTIVFAEIESR